MRSLFRGWSRSKRSGYRYKTDWNPADAKHHCWRTNEKGSSVVRKVGTWYLDSQLPKDANVNDHIKALLSQLAPYAEGIKAAAKQFNHCALIIGIVVTEEESEGFAFGLVTEDLSVRSKLGVPVFFSIIADRE